MTYAEKLRDPRWQRRRLQILEGADWRCESCGNGADTLNVHHLVYSTADPWDSADEELECLCETCHEWRSAWDRETAGLFERTTISTKFCREWCQKFVTERDRALRLAAELVKLGLPEAVVPRGAARTEGDSPVPEEAEPPFFPEDAP